MYAGRAIPPWESNSPDLSFLSFIRAYIRQDMKILEVGSGLGHNALALARSGFDVTASDVAPHSVRRCAELANREQVEMHCQVLDVLHPPKCFGKYDLIFDKGCWHSFFIEAERKAFAVKMSVLLVEGGLWINGTGCADNEDDPNDPNVSTYPRWTLGEIISYTEECFEILQVRKGVYGRTKGNNFLIWQTAFKKRANKTSERTR